MATMTTSTLPPAIQEYYDRVLLERAQPFLVAQKFAQNRPLKERNGTQIKFRRYNALDPATTPLTEGVTPAGNTVTYTDITATIGQYGDFLTFSDTVVLTSPDPLLTEFTELLGEQMGQTLDSLTYQTLVAGTNVIYTGGATSRSAVTATISTTELELAIRSLRRQNARKITEIIKPGPGFNTIPVRPAYVAFCHPDVARDIENLEGFIPIEKYPSTMKLLDDQAEFGAWRDIRFLMSTLVPVFSGAGGASTDVVNTSGQADIYNVIIVAKNAYAVTRLGAGDAKVIVKTHENDTSDVSAFGSLNPLTAN